MATWAKKSTKYRRDRVTVVIQKGIIESLELTCTRLTASTSGSPRTEAEVGRFAAYRPRHAFKRCNTQEVVCTLFTDVQFAT